jgi:hypothetical protein
VELDGLLGRVAARLGGWSHGGPVFHNGQERPPPSAGRWDCAPTDPGRSSIPYHDARSQGPVDCSTVPVAKKSWATAMA